MRKRKVKRGRSAGAGVSAYPVDWSNPTVRQIFGGEGQEPLTDALIDELVAEGMPRHDLQYARSQGAVYCRPRSSLVFPLTFDGVIPPNWREAPGAPKRGKKGVSRG